MLDPNSWRLPLFYVGTIAGALLLFIGFTWVGEQALSPAVPVVPPAPRSIDTMLHVLLALAVVLVTARLVGVLFRHLHQPPVIGEVVGGILLGPSFLGAVWPEAHRLVLPDESAPFLSVIAQLGVVLYMFIVGLHLDLRVLRTSGQATLAISHASIVAPFVLGGALALALYNGLAGEGIAFTPFALFLGVSLSVTAFPVLARILNDKGLHKTELGMLALTCAAIDDVTAWCLLAFVVSVSQSTIAYGLVTFGLTIAYIAFMFAVVRPVAAHVVPRLEHTERVDQTGLAVIIAALLASALATELIGIHAIFGAFLLGAVIPHDSRVARDISERLEDLVRVMFLPAFFAFTGMRAEIGLIATWQDWTLCALILIVAIVGKFGGSYAAARLAGIDRHDAAALGILMNTRGLVELIVLNIGLDMQIISPRLFAMLVIMALVTTFMTTPILDALMRGRAWALIPAARKG